MLFDNEMKGQAMRNKRSRSKIVSGVQQNVQNVPEDKIIPPGPDPESPTVETAVSTTEDHQEEPAIEIGDTASGDYPAVTQMTSEEHQAQVDADTEKRVARAKRAGAPRRLSEHQMQACAYLAQNFIGQDDDPHKLIPIEDIPEHMLPMFRPSMANNLIVKNVFADVYDEDTKQLKGVKFTEVGFDFYLSKTRRGAAGPASNGEAKVAKAKAPKPPARVSKYTDDFLLKKMVSNNPRREETHGRYSWDIYQDGMTYHEYMKAPHEPFVTKNGTPFTGPGRNHWDYDLMRGFTALYRKGEPEVLEDGSPNPNYWVINNNTKMVASS